jgi:hypothetical protein
MREKATFVTGKENGWEFRQVYVPPGGLRLLGGNLFYEISKLLLHL